METHQFDVIIIGGGGAGLRAGIACAEVDPKLRVAVVSKVYPMRSHTVAAEGGAAAVVRDEDSLEAHAYDTISGAAWLADQDAVWAFVNEAPIEMTQLEHWGCPWSRQPNGKIATRPFGGMKIERTWFAADKTGFHMLHALFQTSLKYDNLTRFDEYFASQLLVDDGRCQGVAALEMRTGMVHAIVAGGTIMCTGGAGKIFPFTTNGAIKTGDGMAMAYRQGVPLKDMEFIQYHPTGLPGTGILITEAARGEGGILVNKDGYRYLQEYELGTPLDISDPKHPQKRSMELGPRDRLSQAFWGERQKGRTIDSEYGDVVHLDIRHLGEKKIDKKLPFVRELAKKYGGVDPVHQPIPVRPVVHYVMGGIDTDIDTATTLPGLYAAGEAACVSINGANRLGSNSLTELLTFGKRAGTNAATFSKANPISDLSALQAQAEAEQQRIVALLKQEGKERVSGIRTEMNKAMEDGCGIYRSADSLNSTCETLADLRERFKSVAIDDKSNVYNTDLITMLELDFMLDVALTMAHCAREREESRGSHQREDFKERLDETYLKHSMAHYREGEAPKVDYKEVVMDSEDRWPPGERKYGVGTGFKEKGAKSEKKTEAKSEKKAEPKPGKKDEPAAEKKDEPEPEKKDEPAAEKKDDAAEKKDDDKSDGDEG